jgi:hypothetical protein
MSLRKHMEARSKKGDADKNTRGGEKHVWQA